MRPYGAEQTYREIYAHRLREAESRLERGVDSNRRFGCLLRVDEVTFSYILRVWFSVE